LATGRESESTDYNHPTECPHDAEGERRRQSRPVLHDVEDTRLLHGRQVSCAPHREPGGDSGDGLVGTEEDKEDTDTKTGQPRVRASEVVREQHDGQPDQPRERELDDVEAGEPRRHVHQRLNVLVGLGV